MNIDRLNNPPNRRGTDNYKWDGCKETFGHDDLIPLWVADMDFPCPDEVIGALTQRLEHRVLGYAKRSSSYVRAIRDWLQQRHGWSVNEADMLFCPPGPIQAINTLVTLLSQPGDEIVVQMPAYTPLVNVISGNGRKVLENPLIQDGNDYRFDFGQLKEALSDKTKLLILCSPHNPTGRVWSEEELSTLAEICLQHQITVISDEVHADLLLPGQQHTHFGKVARRYQLPAVTVISPCKTFNLAGLPQCTLITDSAGIKTKFKAHMDISQLNLDPPLNALAAETAYRCGAPWLNAVMAYINDNHRLLRKELQRALPQIGISRAQATYLAWLDLRPLGIAHAKLKRILLEEAKVALYEGTEFGQAYEGFFRVNLACSTHLLQQALSQIVAALTLAQESSK
ncbi:MalY/PatB family protein [Bowmanella pacifica]|uniref:cysteine-S-conjugate beta-lyase n=1 Tax=Bowmanella pacifica TaxID=502051 RepID=A0A918DHD1_9ALTE|nr:MalY/PatB family protein [Bowmanella pacifica]GGO65299.1 cystathionine beta-lyase PatB [Bowmanella pacifica]